MAGRRKHEGDTIAFNILFKKNGSQHTWVDRGGPLGAGRPGLVVRLPGRVVPASVLVRDALVLLEEGSARVDPQAGVVALVSDRSVLPVLAGNKRKT